MIHRSARAASCARLLAFIPVVVVAGGGCSSSKSDEATSATQGSGGGAAEASVPKVTIPECRNGKPLLLSDGSESGYVSCEGYSVHRPVVKACPSKLPRDLPCGSASLGGCANDAACTTKPYGYCHAGSGSAACACEYGCTNDADCGQGLVCVCGDVVGRCEKATCTSDADCGGLLCLSANDTACGKIFACQSPKDTCASPADCKAPFDDCQYVGDHRECRAPKLCP